MQKNNKFFDDLAKMASSAGGTLIDMKREIEASLSVQMEKMLARMDLVTKEDFKMVKEMASKARSEQEKLQKRVEQLEKKLGAKPAAKKPVAKKAPAKKAPAKKKPAAKNAAKKAPAKSKS